MDHSLFYNPNNNSSSSSTPILIPSSHTRRATTSTKNGKKKCNNSNKHNLQSSSSSSNNNNNNNNSKEDAGVRLSTDPQSVAARERRHRISDRFKMLQSLVPGGTKLDTVSMLDQAIQYVKFLKAQILLHEAILKNNNNNVNNNTNDQDQYDHGFISYNSSSTSTTNNDAHYYDQYYYALMYDCNNNNVSQREGCGAGGCDRGGSFCNHQEIKSMVVASSIQAAQIPDVWGNYQGYDQQSMYAL